jgi:hypothetical protein
MARSRHILHMPMEWTNEWIWVQVNDVRLI